MDNLALKGRVPAGSKWIDRFGGAAWDHEAAFNSKGGSSVKLRLVTVLLAGAALVPLTVAGVAGVASPAGAVSKPTISCTLLGTATISPGVSNTPAIQTLTVTTSLPKCTKSSVSGITSSSPSTTSSKGTTPESCADLLKKSKPVTTNSTINWNNGDTSTDTYKTVLDAGSATVKGTITGGDAFAGGKLKASITYTPGAGQNCTTVPLTSATLSGTFEIT